MAIQANSKKAIMNIIIPMAGRGSRIRPHSITTPKPLLPIAGVPIVGRLIETLKSLTDKKINHIGFIIGKDFGEEIEEYLKNLAKENDAKCSIYYQGSPEGIAHALLCAEELFEGNTMIALADTLFVTEEKIDVDEEDVIFVQEVEEPSQFGVVTLNEQGYISELIEKPQNFVSNKAIVGIYYFKNGADIKEHMKHLLENNIRTKGEFQLTDAIERLRESGSNIAIQSLDEWLDCGNKKNVLKTNKRVLELIAELDNSSKNVNQQNSIIIPPCFIGENVTIENSIVGPHVSIGEGSKIENSIIKTSLLQKNVTINNANLKKSMLGSHVVVNGNASKLSLGDYSISE